MGSVGFSLYLLLVSCVFVLVSIDACRCPACSYPNDSDANFCQACGKPLSLEAAQGTGPNCGHAFDQQALYRIQRIVWGQTLTYERQKDSCIRSSAIEFLTLSCTAKESFFCHRGRHRKVFWLARTPRENKNSIYANALVRPVVALSVWRPELSIHI